MKPCVCVCVCARCPLVEQIGTTWRPAENRKVTPRKQRSHHQQKESFDEART